MGCFIVTQLKLPDLKSGYAATFSGKYEGKRLVAGANISFPGVEPHIALTLSVCPDVEPRVAGRYSGGGFYSKIYFSY